jgi:hypothetical protein
VEVFSGGKTPWRVAPRTFATECTDHSVSTVLIQSNATAAITTQRRKHTPRQSAGIKPSSKTTAILPTTRNLTTQKAHTPRQSAGTKPSQQQALCFPQPKPQITYKAHTPTQSAGIKPSSINNNKPYPFPQPQTQAPQHATIQLRSTASCVQRPPPLATVVVLTRALHTRDCGIRVHNTQLHQLCSNNQTNKTPGAAANVAAVSATARWATPQQLQQSGLHLQHENSKLQLPRGWPHPRLHHCSSCSTRLQQLQSQAPFPTASCHACCSCCDSSRFTMLFAI